ncbi:uncharacterized protein LOC121142268 [Mesocricetus auratus]|uniref:Uncharacterized protein LOC121142268 n=1 Tax=Mesocricetus auratus TaxID=10036 RepID=A0ABM2Y1T4_MESAU|nr:uncharacterized protein LOC121142268 [Mesocricetus auratus]
MLAGQGAGRSGLREAVRPGISRLLSARHPQLLGLTGRGARRGKSAAGWQSLSGSLPARGGAAAGAAPPAGRGEAGGTRRTARRPPCPAALVPWARAGARPSPGPSRWGSSGAGTPLARKVYREWRSPGAARKVASTAWERASWKVLITTKYLTSNVQKLQVTNYLVLLFQHIIIQRTTVSFRCQDSSWRQDQALPERLYISVKEQSRGLKWLLIASVTETIEQPTNPSCSVGPQARVYCHEKAWGEDTRSCCYTVISIPARWEPGGCCGNGGRAMVRQSGRLASSGRCTCPFEGLSLCCSKEFKETDVSRPGSWFLWRLGFCKPHQLVVQSLSVHFLFREPQLTSALGLVPKL